MMLSIYTLSLRWVSRPDEIDNRFEPPFDEGKCGTCESPIGLNSGDDDPDTGRPTGGWTSYYEIRSGTSNPPQSGPPTLVTLVCEDCAGLVQYLGEGTFAINKPK